MKGIKYSILSLISSNLCIVGLLIHNYNLSLAYLSSGGKTRALFGIIELSRLHIKLYFIPFAFLSIGFGVLAVKKKENKVWAAVSIIACLIAIVSFFIRYWRFMI
jgi:hypothetical protein